MRRYTFVAAIAALFVVPAHGLASTVTQASLSKGKLHITGSGAQPGVTVRAESFGSAASARSDVQGNFTIDASGFVSDDCTAVVSDGTTPLAVPVLSGCTPVAPKPVSSSLPAPSGSCVITPGGTQSIHAGDNGIAAFYTTGCTWPMTWSVVAGSVPRGLHGPSLSGQDAGALTGRPVTEGTSTFTLKVTDQAGRTDYENFSVAITAPRPIAITPATVPAARVGSSYQVNLRGDGGVPGYLWSAGSALPPGFSLSRNMLFSTRATTAGTYTFSIRATDSRGAVGARSYTLTIS